MSHTMPPVGRVAAGYVTTHPCQVAASRNPTYAPEVETPRAQGMTSSTQGRRQSGIALVMLLWMVAGLTLLVSGTVYLARTDVQLTTVQLNQAQAQAAATGIAHLFLRDMLSARQQAAELAEETPVIVNGQYEMNGMTLQVRAIPASGFIELNNAAPELLSSLLQFAAGLGQAEAEELSERIVRWRSIAQTQEMDDSLPEWATAFTVVEDLLRVPGITRQIYDKISHSLYVGNGGTAGINPLAASPAVLQAISQGDQNLVDFMQELRQDGRPASASDVARLDSPYLAFDSNASSVYCLEIDVMISTNRTYQQRIWVDIGSGDAALPWRFSRVMPISMRSSAQEGIAYAR